MPRRPPPRPTLAQLEAQCIVFNDKCPEGGAVLVKLDGVDVPRQTITTSNAYVMCGHTAVVHLQGVSGAYSLDRVTPVPASDLPEPWRHAAAMAGVSLDMEVPTGPTISELIESGDLPAPPQPTPGATER